MQTYLKICLWFSLADILLKAHTISSACAMLELVDKGSPDNTFQVKEDGYVNITFVLNTTYCQNIKDCFKVKFSINNRDLPVPLCTIVFNGTCSATDLSLACHCLNQRQNSASVYTRVNPTDKGFLLEWTDCTSGITRKSSFSITRFIRNEGELGTKEIIGISCALGAFLIVVCAGIIFLRTRTYGGNTAKHNSNNASVRHNEASPCAEYTEVIQLVRPADQPESSEENKYYEPVFPMDLVLGSLKKHLKNEA